MALVGLRVVRLDLTLLSLEAFHCQSLSAVTDQTTLVEVVELTERLEKSFEALQNLSVVYLAVYWVMVVFHHP